MDIPTSESGFRLIELSCEFNKHIDKTYDGLNQKLKESYLETILKEKHIILDSLKKPEMEKKPLVFR